MRNWNASHHLTRLKFVLLFLQYLWGIETLSGSDDVPLSNLRFYSTYEELKLQTFASLTPRLPCFYSTYEELKHYP